MRRSGPCAGTRGPGPGHLRPTATVTLNQRSLDHVSEFSRVAGIVVRRQNLNGLAAQEGGLHAHFARDSPGKVTGERRNISLVCAQGRDFNGAKLILQFGIILETEEKSSRPTLFGSVPGWPHG